jgi:nitroreductase
MNAENMLPIDLLRKRRSLVAAKIVDPGPTDHELSLIIEAGLRVPDHGRCGPWRVQVISKKGQQALGKLYAELYGRENKDASTEQIEYWLNRPSSAPCLVAITYHINQAKIEKIPACEQHLSVGALCQNILNASHALGYVAQWLTEWPSYHDEVKKILGHSVETEISGFIFIGTAAEEPSERKRIGADEVVSYWDG